MHSIESSYIFGINLTILLDSGVLCQKSAFIPDETHTAPTAKHRCSLPDQRGDPDTDRQFFTDASAKVQSDPACLAVDSSVISRISFLKHPRQILRCDTDPGVADTKRIGVRHENANLPGWCVFQRIGQQLPDQK